MAQLICRWPLDGATPNAEEAERLGIQAWLVPCRWAPKEGLALPLPREALCSNPAMLRWSLEVHLDHPLTPKQELLLAAELQDLVLHDGGLQIDGHALLWIHDPQRLSHPYFSLARLKRAIHPGLIALAAGPPEQSCWDGMYERSDWMPCQQMRNGLLNYESFLFWAHHRAARTNRIAVPCVRGDSDQTFAHWQPKLYEEWIEQVSAWCDLDQPDPQLRWVLVENWRDHQAFATSPTPPHCHHTPERSKNTRSTPEERRWGRIDARQPALLVHSFYPDLLKTLLAPLSLGQSKQNAPVLYLSTPHEQLNTTEALLRQQGWQQACLVGVENRGRDIAPFLLELLPRAMAARHPWLIKLHTKRSSNKPGGGQWGQFLIEHLAKPSSIEHLKSKLLDNPNLALIAPPGTLVPASMHLAGNQHHLHHLLNRCGIRQQAWLQQCFVAGSMWAARTQPLQALLDLNLSLDDFEEEAGQTDGTLAHACERLIPAILLTGSGEICEIHTEQQYSLPFGYAWAKAEPQERPIST